MKKLLSILLFIPILGFSQYTAIPDTSFEIALIQLGHDDIIDGQVLTSNISSLTSLDVQNIGISDLTGIEDFTALDTLLCNYNQLTSLDVSQNTALTHLHCWYNQLTSLDVSGCISLTYLNCMENWELTSLDISGCISLTELWCSYNELTSLDVSNNTALERLSCASNQLTSLDVSNNTNLEFFSCYNNQLTSLDVSNNTDLEFFSCYNNQLTSLDLSQNTALTNLSCESNQLECLNLKNGNNYYLYLYAYDNPNLSCIEVDDPSWAYNNWTFGNDNIDGVATFSTDCNYPFGCGGASNCNDVFVSDTTEFYVSSTSFQTISPELYLADSDTFVRPNNPDCDSIIYRYNKYTYSNCGNSDTLYVDITITPPTGTIDITNTISIYPNPANDIITISNGNFSTMTNYELRILNSLGQEVFSNLVVVPQFIVPVSSLGAEGTYFVQVLDGDGNLVVTKYLILN